ncbi:MAG: hypothetical protein LBP65_02015 [Puniceicoccales bacterium]|nr:hypothetical protein [Puniceicoccales bacterium]
MSEFMLQQTRVAMAIPYFHRWMERLPTLSAAAAAEPSTILLLWSGLGYYARARNLHHLCQVLASLPTIPVEPAVWQRFPGVGPYTATAILSLAGLMDAIPLDGNGLRILARLVAAQGSFANRSALERSLRPMADLLRIPGRCGAVGEALMDLGSSICLPAKPRCEICPIRPWCQLAGRPKEMPAPLPIRPRRREIIHRVWICDGAVLWLQRPMSGRLRHVFELPEIPSTAINRRSNSVLLQGMRTIGSVIYREIIYDGQNWPTMDQWQAVAIPELNSIPISGPHRRWIRTILERESELSPKN